jgi:spore coat protein A
VQTRRDFLKTTAAAGAGLAAYSLLPTRKAWGFYQTPATPLWATSFRGVGPGAIPVAAPDLLPAPVTGAAHYTINMSQFTDQIHPSLGPTTLWGFNPASALGMGGLAQTPAHLGGIIVAQRNVPIQITFNNNLPATSIIPVDTTIPGANQAQNRTAIHLHGGFVPWISDGGPHDWFAPDGSHGLSFLNNAVLNPTALANQAEYFYPNQQSARLMWYHDHAWGITRTNAYAGIASAYIIRDAFEGNLRNQGLPDFIENGGRELPIIIQDKIFVGPNIATIDPTWTGPSAPGSLWYAHVYDTARYGKVGPAPLGALPAISCVPEYFGDTMLANGTVYPQVTVEARRYRLRILNACNARFVNLQLYVDDGTPNGITLSNQGNPLNAPARNAAAPNPNGKPTSNFLVIGSEGGLLPNPALVPSGIPFNGTPAAGALLLAPAERVDVIFDFSAHAGQKLILYTDAPAPFPGGSPLNDYFPGLTNKNPVNGLTAPGSGPNTREIMRFNVIPATSADPPLTINTATSFLAGIDPLLVPAGVTALPPGVAIRPLTLNETFDGYGRLIQMLGTNVALTAGTFGRAFMDPPTETPRIGNTEVWQIANLTADTHPIHFHLVNLQIISRQAFAVNSYTGVPNLQGAPTPPLPYETGWKETIRMNPGEVINVIAKYVLPTTPFVVPTSPRTGGYEYVWHCHILEHEEHDMMRPMVVS